MLAQIVSGTDIADNLAQLTTAARAAASAGAQLVFFPEYTMYEKPVVDSTFATVAQPLDGEFGSAVAAVAAANQVAIAAGVVEYNPNDISRPFNTIAVWDCDGALAGRHRKSLLYDVATFSESEFISAGDIHEPSVATINGTTFGLQTCYELRFPEISRRRMCVGATELAVLSSWVPGRLKTEQWMTLARARAIENICHVVAVTQAAPLSTGHSLAVAPDGEVLAALGTDADRVCVEIDPSRTIRQRLADPAAVEMDLRRLPPS
ncbi:nitrilase-related carbon-nitrogen hydrolase [Nocardia amamiensis]|uniref:nitrilase-related carbon-nitrogen hydrolase n=1 Tax=Nocardia amamiensis TaxID=404578 RepID=UPI0034029760